MKAYLLKITGDVQGVSYRYFARTEAKKLGILGFARNEHDGSVTIMAQGDPEATEAFLAWAKDGSPMATVDNIEITAVKIDPKLTGFEVK